MEDALRGFGLFTFTDDGKRVLILVLMEDALRGADYDSSARPTASLNPCSNRRCSASIMYCPVVSLTRVLILVLMEDALREEIQFHKQNPIGSLNPCSNGRCSARPGKLVTNVQ